MIQNVHCYSLSLSDRIDDEIFEHTMKAFPELADPPYDSLVKLDEEWMKSPDGKERWRNFIERWELFFRLASLLSRHGHVLIILFLFYFSSSYKGRVTDYNFGCLIRSDARGEYGEQNTIFGEFLSLTKDMIHAKLWIFSPVTRIQVCLSCF